MLEAIQLCLEVEGEPAEPLDFIGVTLYLDEVTIKWVRRAARASGLSQSRWLAELVRERTAPQWRDAVRDLAGAWPDFPKAGRLRRSVARDIRRERL